MSATTATLIGAAIAGTFGIAGVLAGLIAERVLRSRGEVWCEAEPLQLTVRVADPRGESYGLRNRKMSGLGPIGRGDVAQARSVEYRVGADFYNGRDLPASLRAFEVLFHRPGDTPMRSEPQDGRTERPKNIRGTPTVPVRDPLKVLNLPPRHLVALEISGYVPDVARLEGCDRVELRAEFPDRTPFSHDLARLDPSVVLAG